jgi:hypothetical protein
MNVLVNSPVRVHLRFDPLDPPMEYSHAWLHEALEIDSEKSPKYVLSSASATMDATVTWDDLSWIEHVYGEEARNFCRDYLERVSPNASLPFGAPSSPSSERAPERAVPPYRAFQVDRVAWLGDIRRRITHCL